LSISDSPIMLKKFWHGFQTLTLKL